MNGLQELCTVCTSSLDPFYLVIYYIKRGKTPWTYSNTDNINITYKTIRVHDNNFWRKKFNAKPSS